MKFFIVDFPIDFKDGELKYLIAYPTFTGMGLGAGISTYIFSEEDIKKLFTVSDQTFKELAKELEKEYFKETNEPTVWSPSEADMA